MTRLFGLSALALLLAACGSDGLKNTLAQVGEACGEQTPCASAGVCLDGICRARCDSLHACGEGTRCENGGCVPHEIKCGDGVKEGAEQCDDKNVADGDGCSKTCTLEKAPPAWSAGAWGACSVGCGDGVQVRSVRCLDSAGNPVAESQCEGDKPTGLQACRGTECSCAPTSCTGSCVLDVAGEQTAVVPPSCPKIRVQAWGGGGAGGSQQGATGGGGAFVEATLAVSSGESLAVEVAEGGTDLGLGGGASSVLRGSTALLVAAGGGGGGSDGCSGCKSGGRGGAGGGDKGEDGSASSGLAPFCTAAPGGKGATQTAGGEGGVVAGIGEYQCNGEAGAEGKGGSSNGAHFAEPCWRDRAEGWRSGGGQSNGGGGGGGAGRFGGGGGAFVWTYCGGGGGGGSSWVDPQASGVQLVGGQQQQPGSSALGSGAGRGGNPGEPGRSGKVVIHWGG